MYRHIATLHQLSRRTLSSSARRQVENKVPQKQKLFQLSLYLWRSENSRELPRTDRLQMKNAAPGAHKPVCFWAGPKPGKMQRVVAGRASDVKRCQIIMRVNSVTSIPEESSNEDSENNGIPVHLKGGAGDAVLYRTTMGLTILGTVFVIYELVKAALPQKK